MCCFAGPVASVRNPRIFARLSGTGTQLLAYQMEYSSESAENAMILPLPVLKRKEGRPHPMALFFPTVHIHDGEVHDREGAGLAWVIARRQRRAKDKAREEAR